MLLLFAASCSGGSTEATDVPSTHPSPSVTVDPDSAATVYIALPTIPEGSGESLAVPSTTIPPPVIPSDVLFDTAEATLKPEATPYLVELAQEIAERHAGARLNFVGHTDSRGTDEANQALSALRASAVLDWFAQHGFDRQLLTAEGAGERRLLAPDTDENGRFIEQIGQENRRVEIEIG
ncbi:MAG: OmpA family protein [Actinobacteria bacterium]|nr:OmpA family protein [Actinomycetota bacterium]